MSKNIDDMLYSLINSDYEKWKTRFNFHIRGTYNSYYSFDNKIKQMYLIALILIPFHIFEDTRKFLGHLREDNYY